MADNKTVVTGKVRLSYTHLVKPYAMQPGQEEKFSTTVLVPKTDFATKQKIDAAIQAAIHEGVASKWNGQRPAQPAVPVYDGDGVRANGEPFGPECKGHWVFTASTKQKPEVVDAQLNSIMDATEIYSGMYARVSVQFYTYFSSGKKGVGCGLGPVQKLADGEPMGGARVSAASAFGDGFGEQQAPQYQQPVYQQTAPPFAQQAPQYQQPVYAQPSAIDPITGLPVGSVLGI